MEGVIKFRYTQDTNPALDDAFRLIRSQAIDGLNTNLSANDGLISKRIRGLLALRQFLFKRSWTGWDAGRYDGAAFGNVSCRLADGANFFLISGSQTGKIRRLLAKDLSIIGSVNLAENWVMACGPTAPSSETMSHAAVYAAMPDCRFVLHIHHPDIWRDRQKLEIPVIAANCSYGTPEMAIAIQSAVTAMREKLGSINGENGTQAMVVALAGHEDGLLAYGLDGLSLARVLRRLHARQMALVC